MLNVSIVYKVLSMLLMYPDANLKLALNDFLLIFNNEKFLSEQSRENVFSFIKYFIEEDLLNLQQLYVDTFDRQKIYSLYLFEHVHGDSKDRGQAMVDLQNMYISNGFKINSYELPDYLPVFLEYLSLISKEDSSCLLGEVINIIAIIGFRLKESNNLYNKLFFVLEDLSNVKFDKDIIESALFYKKNVKIDEEFENEWIEPTFYYDKKFN